MNTMRKRGAVTADHELRRHIYHDVTNHRSFHVRTYDKTSRLYTHGPLLFLLYINDLPNCLNSVKCNMFADDIPKLIHLAMT